MTTTPETKDAPKKKKKHEVGSGWVSRIMLAVVSIGALGVMGVAGGAAALLFFFGHDLPDFHTLENYQPPIVTRAYASDGRLLAEFATERRVFVPIDSVPPLVIHAFLSAEDKNFYSHPGIDVFGIIRAGVTNLRNSGTGTRLKGASTITQQVAKNFLLGNQVSFSRKIKEMILSFKIEQAMSKNQILELYLNEIFLGEGSYGVAAAALEYFNKPLDELTVEEAAYLAALPKGPNNYNIDRHYQAALDRRNWVIGEMQDNHYITPEQAAAAKAVPIKWIHRDQDQYVNNPYFAEEVRRKLMELYGEKSLYEGGLIAHTTMIPAYQEIAEKALRNGLMAYDMRHGFHSDAIAKGLDTKNWQAALAKVPAVAGQGDLDLAVVLETGDKQATIGLKDGKTALITYNKMRWASRHGVTPSKVSDLLKVGDVWLTDNSGEMASGKQVYWLREIPNVSGGVIVMDPHSGRVFAIAGGFSYELSQFDRATQAVRQPGSSFKPFVYLAGLEAGFTPATLILDAPFMLDQGPGLAKWTPKNYHGEFNGPTPMRVGLEKSLNLMTIRLANYVGMEKIADICNQFGVIDNLPLQLSMAIGAGDTTLWRMVSAYSTFVNGGKKIEPTLIDRIQDRTGKTVYMHDEQPCDGCGPLIPWNNQATPQIADLHQQIADPRYMYQLVSMMEGVVQRGTAMYSGLKELGRPIAGKTGTTNDSKDTWFIGFTPDIIIGAYVGFDDPKTLGSHETGAVAAAPIVKEFMEKALKDVPPAPFRVPEGIRLVQINERTGTRAKPDDDKTILEAFIAGTEPGDEAMMFTGQGVSSVSDVTNVGEGVSTGLGGLY